MTVPKSRETSAVYKQQDRGQLSYKGSLYTALAAYILHLFLYFLALSSLYPSTF